MITSEDEALDMIERESQSWLETWEEHAKLLRVLAHPVRLAILQVLCEHPNCVKHINAAIPIPQPHLSQHIAALRKANLVACHACGPVRCYYVLRPQLVEQLIVLLRADYPCKRRDSESVLAEARAGLSDAEVEECKADGS